MNETVDRLLVAAKRGRVMMPRLELPVTFAAALAANLQRSVTRRRYRDWPCLCARGLQVVPRSRAGRRVAENPSPRPGFSRYREHPRDDGDGPPRLPEEFSPEDAELDP